MRKLSIRDLDLQRRRVLVRVDFNVPLEGGRVGDDARIRAVLPTLRLLHASGARSVLCSHLGRPKGRPDARFSLQPVATCLGELLRAERLGGVDFCSEICGDGAERAARALAPGDFLLLENLRFDAGEEANAPDFSRRLAALGEVYVNDAFGSAHRAHASTVGVTQWFDRRAAGLLMQAELEHLDRLLHDPAHPYVVVLGGAKVSDKLPVIRSLARRADQLLIGGAMAYTFLAARGEAIGDSLHEPGLVGAARELLADSGKSGATVQLPCDHVVAASAADAQGAAVVKSIPPGRKGLDIGPETRAAYAQAIAGGAQPDGNRRSSGAAMVFWNGPMGVFETPPFDAGTLAIARAMAECRGITVAGGGDSVAALNACGLAGRLTHVSTGGGAALEFLAGDELPGVTALSDAAG